MLLQFGATMERDGYGMTPLLSASVTGHTNIVDELTTHDQVRVALIASPPDRCAGRHEARFKLDLFPIADKPYRAH